MGDVVGTKAMAVRREAAELLKQPPGRLVEMVIGHRILLAEMATRLARLEAILGDADTDQEWPPQRGRRDGGGARR